jgi:ketosteroid isomerase-like protein
MKMLRVWMASMMLGATFLGMASAALAKTDDQAAIKKLENDLAAAMSAKDIDGIMSFYLPGETLFVFDCIPPRQYVGAKAYRKDFEGFLGQYPGPTKVEVSDLAITTDGQLGFAHYVMHMIGTTKDGTKAEMNFRLTDCPYQVWKEESDYLAVLRRTSVRG